MYGPSSYPQFEDLITQGADPITMLANSNPFTVVAGIEDATSTYDAAVHDVGVTVVEVRLLRALESDLEEGSPGVESEVIATDEQTEDRIRYLDEQLDRIGAAQELLARATTLRNVQKESQRLGKRFRIAIAAAGAAAATALWVGANVEASIITALEKSPQVVEQHDLVEVELGLTAAAAGLTIVCGEMGRRAGLDMGRAFEPFDVQAQARMIQAWRRRKDRADLDKAAVVEPHSGRLNDIE